MPPKLIRTGISAPLDIMPPIAKIPLEAVIDFQKQAHRRFGSPFETHHTRHATIYRPRPDIIPITHYRNADRLLLQGDNGEINIVIDLFKTLYGDTRIGEKATNPPRRRQKNGHMVNKLGIIAQSPWTVTCKDDKID